MANTYTQLHIQVVFAVRNRHALIDASWRDELYRYITGIVQHYEHKMLAIGGMPDHVHILIGMRPTQALADLMQDIKGSSSKWINERRLAKGKFAWQEGYGAFSYSREAMPNVINYILNQEAHHRKKSLREEYIGLLKEFEIDHDERFIFKEPDNGNGI
jgi:REP element-mobilizing transposase RayT